MPERGAGSMSGRLLSRVASLPVFDFHHESNVDCPPILFFGAIEKPCRPIGCMGFLFFEMNYLALAKRNGQN